MSKTPETITTIRKAVAAYIKKEGVSMSKKIHDGGLFSNATYDRRTAYSIKDLNKLSAEGFHLNESLGALLFWAIMEQS